MKKILLPILVIVIAFAAMGCGVTNSNERNATDDKKQSDTENNASNDTADTSAPDDSSADKADEKSDNDAKKYGVGETVDIKGVKITLESVDMSYGDRDEEFSAFAPQEGNVFAVCNFLIENNSDKELDINSFYFNAYEDGFAVDSYIFTEGIGVKDLNGTASPGRKIKGALVYEVSEDFKELEIEYQPSFWNDKKALFIYTNK